MREKNRGNALKELMTIPGVGPKMAGALWSLGVRSVADLKGRGPQELYDKLCALTGKRVDRCVLYVFRLAVYYASETGHKPELLKWWNWKD